MELSVTWVKQTECYRIGKVVNVPWMQLAFATLWIMRLDASWSIVPEAFHVSVSDFD